MNCKERCVSSRLMALYTVFYNCMQVHKALRLTLAM